MSDSIVTQATDLSQLAKRINEEHAACERDLKDGLRHATEAGNLLNKVKEVIQHGDWLAWVEENCDFSIRSAQGYMRVAKVLPTLEGANAQRVAHLDFRTALSAFSSANHKELCDAKKAARVHAATPLGLMPAPSADRRMQLFRNEEEGLWSVEFGPNEAYLKLPERVKAAEQSELCQTFQTAIDTQKQQAADLRNEAKLLVRQADKAEAAARGTKREMAAAIKCELEEQYGQAECTESIDFRVDSDEQDAHLKTLPNDDIVEYLLTHCDNESVCEVARGYWGDFSLHPYVATEQVPSSGAWTKLGGMDGTLSAQLLGAT